MGQCGSSSLPLDGDRDYGASDGSQSPNNDDADYASGGPLTTKEIRSRQESSGKNNMTFAIDYLQFQGACLTQRGYYPDEMDKENQDSYSCHTKFGDQPGSAFFAVYDGHGRDGHLVSKYTQKFLPLEIATQLQEQRGLRDGNNAFSRGVVQISRGLSEGLIAVSRRLSSGNNSGGKLSRNNSASNKLDERGDEAGSGGDNSPSVPRMDPLTSDEVVDALRKAHLNCNEKLRALSSIGSDLAGTTSVSCYMNAGKLYISNLGDSRAIIVSRGKNGRGTVVKPLSKDQTPYRKDERDRVRKYGARIMSMDQLDGLEPIHDNWRELTLGEDLDEGGDPPRLWHPTLRVPGTAFTRSIGDFFAENIGVTADPEIEVHDIDEQNDLYVILCSDGVFEFMTNRTVANVVMQKKSPIKACKELVKLAYEAWLEEEVRTDDITAVVLQLIGNEVAGVPGHSPSEPNTEIRSVNSAAQMLSMPSPIKSISSNQDMSGNFSSLGDDEEDSIFRDRVPSDANASEDTWQERSSVHDEGSSKKARRPRKSIIIQSSTQDEELSIGLDIASIDYPKTAADEKAISVAIANNFLFQHATPAQRQDVIRVMQPMNIKKGQTIITEGDAGSDSDHFYVVYNGKFEVRQNNSVIHTYEGDPKKNIHPGFGELSLLYDKPRAASVIAVEGGKVFALNRVIFKQVVIRNMDILQGIIKCLRLVPPLDCLDIDRKQKLAYVLSTSEATHKVGDIFQAESKTLDNTIFMIMKGRLCVKLRGSTKSTGASRMTPYKNKEILGPGTLFGLSSLLRENGANSDGTSEFVNYSLVVKEDCTVLSCSRTKFEATFGETLSSMQKVHKQTKEKLRRPSSVAPPSFLQVSCHGFIQETDISRLRIGTFGALLQSSNSSSSTKSKKANYNDTNVSVKTFVLSEVDNLLRKDPVTTMLEASRMVSGLSLQSVAAQYIPKLMSVYRENNALHLLYDRPMVGDLFTVLQFGSSSSLSSSIDMKACTKYIISAVAQALWTIHATGIIYRNVNTEGILVTSDGKLSFADFTLSKVMGKDALQNGCKTYTICGNSNYMAPEQLSQAGHDQTVDFWALGVLCYEILTDGESPFADKNEIATYSRIAAYAANPSKNPIAYDNKNSLHKEAQVIISQLLSANNQNRLTDEKTIKAHEFFNGEVDWNNANRDSPLKDLATKELKNAVDKGISKDQSDTLQNLFDTARASGGSTEDWAKNLISS